MAEIASASVRGMLGSCFQLMVTIGVLYVGIVGAFLPWRLEFIQDLKLKSHSIFQVSKISATQLVILLH